MACFANRASYYARPSPHMPKCRNRSDPSLACAKLSSEQPFGTAKFGNFDPYFDFALTLTLIAFLWFGSLLVIRIRSLVLPFLVGENTTTTL